MPIPLRLLPLGLLLGLLSGLPLAGACTAEGGAPLASEREKMSYSVGYQVGGDFARQGLHIDPELVIRGVEDALAGADPAMTTEEMQRTLVDLKKKVVAAEEDQRRERASENRSRGEAFLAANAKKEGVVALASGLQYRVLAEGSGEPPGADDSVTIHYRGTRINGSEFYSTYGQEQPPTFALDGVIPGWAEGLRLMRPGSRYELFVPPELAYGDSGSGTEIGPGATLVFEVELLSVQHAQ